VDQDIRSVADFIARWTTENGRWRSPKYLLGESYGGIRAAGLAYHLQTRHYMNLNGVILVSPFLHFASGVDGVGVDLPHVLYLPALAATAWYHEALEDRPAALADFLEEVERFAMDEYRPALMRGFALPAE
jgi:carboxypeptidase C (cathepsin A)